jgi:anionic cell wall polymer biosynthesis LytR-Cps2A-Psr (LCP) family protein
MTERVRYRRTWPQRGLLVGCAAVIGTALYTASTVGDVYDDIAAIHSIQLETGVLTDHDDVDPGGPRNILLVGTTENDGIDPDDPLVNERSNTFLADTIMLMRVDPDNEQAQVLSSTATSGCHLSAPASTPRRSWARSPTSSRW